MRRGLFWAQLGAVLGMLVLGMYQNGGVKFIRVRPREGCRQGWYDIKQQDIERDVSCGCSDASDAHAVCESTSGWAKTINGVITTILGAWCLPLIPFITSTLVLGMKGRTLKRGCLYIVVILYRSYILFHGFNYVQGLWQRESVMTCAYQELRKDHRCREELDFSDHVVLIVVHFVAIPVYEVFAACCELQDPGQGKTKYDSEDLAFRRAGVALVAVEACGLCLSGLFTARATMVFLHSQSETLLAGMICLFFAQFPLAALFGIIRVPVQILSERPYVYCRSD